MSKIKTAADKITKLFVSLWERRRDQKNITVIIFSQLYIFLLAFLTAFFVFWVLADFERSTLALILGEDSHSRLMNLLPFIIALALILTALPFVPHRYKRTKPGGTQA